MYSYEQTRQIRAVWITIGFALTFSDKPIITYSVTRKQILVNAPNVLDLTFNVDSFPSSKVKIFHETKRLTFIQNVTGQHSLNVTIKSCLDKGEYKVVAENDAGFDSFTFIANVNCKFRF